jgi:hypothetical protein
LSEPGISSNTGNVCAACGVDSKDIIAACRASKLNPPCAALCAEGERNATNTTAPEIMQKNDEARPSTLKRDFAATGETDWYVYPPLSLSFVVAISGVFFSFFRWGDANYDEHRRLWSANIETETQNVLLIAPHLFPFFPLLFPPMTFSFPK